MTTAVVGLIGVLVLALTACQSGTTGADAGSSTPSGKPSRVCSALAQVGPDGSDTAVIVHVNEGFSGMSDAQLAAVVMDVRTNCPQYLSVYEYERLRRSDAAPASPSSAATAGTLSGSSSPPAGAVVSPLDAQAKIIYVVTGSARSATISYVIAVQRHTVQGNLPWSHSTTIAASYKRVLYVSAQATGSGDVTCAIKIAGTVVISNTAHDLSSTATCIHNG